MLLMVVAVFQRRVHLRRCMFDVWMSELGAICFGRVCLLVLTVCQSAQMSDEERHQEHSVSHLYSKACFCLFFLHDGLIVLVLVVVVVVVAFAAEIAAAGIVLDDYDDDDDIKKLGQHMWTRLILFYQFILCVNKKII